MTDLIERLRKSVKGYPHGCTQSKTWHEAADEIERLTADFELATRLRDEAVSDLYKEQARVDALGGCTQCMEPGKIAPMDISSLQRQVGGSHYKGLKIQPIEYAHANGMGPCEFLCLRYISRHREKNGRQDIEKAIHTLQLLLDLEYQEAE